VWALCAQKKQKRHVARPIHFDMSASDRPITSSGLGDIPEHLRPRVLALARGEFTPPPETSIQKTCGVSAALAFLASLAIPEPHAPPYTKDEENLFARLQVYYRHSLGQTNLAHTLYKLSPLVAPPAAGPAPAAAQAPAAAAVPTPAQTAAAEAKAKRAETELLALLEHEARSAKPPGDASKSRSQQRRGNSKKQEQKPPPQPERILAHRSEAGGSTEGLSLEEIIAVRGTPMEEADYREDEWTAVGAKSRGGATPSMRGNGAASRKGAPTPDATSTSVAAPAAAKVATAAAGVIETSSVDRGMIPATTLPPQAAATPSPDKSSSEKPPPAPQAPVEQALDETQRHVSAPATSLPELSDQSGESVASLRAELEALRLAHADELRNVRQSHERALALAQERESMRLQRLQLQLYIETSRVAVLEGALAKHAAAVGKLHTSEDIAPDEIKALTLVQQDAARIGRASAAEPEPERPPGAQRALAQAVMDASE